MNDDGTKSNPRWLFRTWTDQSNGSNSSTRFAPALRFPANPATEKGLFYDRQRGMLKNQLKRALAGSMKTRDNPFVFFTSSMLLAIQHAIDKKSKGHTNVRIDCIDTLTARTSTNAPVEFSSAVDLMKSLDIENPRAYWTKITRDYRDVYVTTSSVCTGADSRTVEFQALVEAGLFRLLPEFEVIKQWPRPGLETPVRHLRKLWFDQYQSVGIQQMNLAAKLASAFKCTSDASALERDLERVIVPTHLVCWFLVLKSVDPRGSKFNSWLELVPGSVESFPSAGNSGVVEVDRFEELCRVLRNKDFPADLVASFDCNVRDSDILMEKEAYKEMRAERNEAQKDRKIEEEKSLKRKAEADEVMAPVKKLKMPTVAINAT